MNGAQLAASTTPQRWHAAVRFATTRHEAPGGSVALGRAGWPSLSSHTQLTQLWRGTSQPATAGAGSSARAEQVAQQWVAPQSRWQKPGRAARVMQPSRSKSSWHVSPASSGA